MATPQRQGSALRPAAAAAVAAAGARARPSPRLTGIKAALSSKPAGRQSPVPMLRGIPSPPPPETAPLCAACLMAGHKEGDPECPYTESRAKARPTAKISHAVNDGFLDRNGEEDEKKAEVEEED